MRPVALFLLGAFFFACDASDDYEDCRYSATFDDPRGARCPGSTFPSENDRSREIAGVVYRGEAPAANAIVRMDPRSPQAEPTRSSYVPVTTVSDSAGFYRIKNVPFHYDLTVRVEEDIFAYRDLSARYFEPTLAKAELPRTWSSDVEVVVLPPPRPGNVVTFVGSGESIISVSGDAAKGALVAMRNYTALATIHAIEHPAGTLIDRATSYGKVDVNVIAGRRATAEVRTTPIDRFDTLTFTASLPEGFTLEGAVDVFIDFGPRTNLLHFTSTQANVTIDLPVFPSPNGAYATARAKRNGAISTTNLYPMPARTGTIVLPFPAPPTLRRSSAGPTFVSAEGSGVIEHVLRPANGARGPTVHLVTTEYEAPLPDLELLGFARLSGRWVWTARDFPKVPRVDKMGRTEWLLQPNATSEPMEIEFP